MPSLQKGLVVLPLLLVGMAILAACGTTATPATLPETGATSMPGGMGDGMMEGTVSPGEMMSGTVSPGGMMNETTTPGEMGGSTMGAADFDQAFIYMMVPHHEGAIEMARIAQQRAEHPEIKAMADDIIAGQEAEAEQMRGWLQQWYGSSETPPMSAMPMMSDTMGMGSAMETMDMGQDVEDLRNAPEPFDLAFIDAMMSHHQQAVDAAQLAVQQATRSEIRDLAQAIIDAQQREIEELRAWRQAWYPDAPSGSSRP